MDEPDLPRVGVLHAPFGAASLREILKAAAGLAEVVWIFTAEVAAAEPEIVRVAGQLGAATVTPSDEVASAAARLRVDGLTTFHDAMVDPCDAALAQLGLPGAGTIPDPWDKLSQRRRLTGAGLSRVECREVNSRDDFMIGRRELAQPCVLKPRRGVGGSGVAFIESDADEAYQLRHRRDWTDLLLETRLPEGRHPAADWLADFVSVETASTASDRFHLAVFDKAPVHVERHAGRDGADAVAVTGDITPSRLPPDLRAAVLDHVDRCLERLGVRWRVTHTEVRLTPDGPDLVEINGRVGGHLNRLLRLVNGPDLIQTALGLALGRQPRPHAAPEPGFAMGFFPPFPRRGHLVRSAVRRSDLRRLPSVVGVDEVAQAGREQSETGYRMANLTLFAETARSLDELARSIPPRLRELFVADIEAEKT
jgi:hypothetical protein